MELILLKEVDNLGREGDVVNVKNGYARNFLIPQKLAVRLTPGTEKMISQLLEQREKKRIEDVEKAQEVADRIVTLSCTITVKVGENDRLYGSVTNQDISDALLKENISIDKKMIIIPEPIKELGVYNIEIKIRPEVTATLKVWVVKE